MRPEAVPAADSPGGSAWHAAGYSAWVLMACWVLPGAVLSASLAWLRGADFGLLIAGLMAGVVWAFLPVPLFFAGLIHLVAAGPGGVRWLAAWAGAIAAGAGVEVLFICGFFQAAGAGPGQAAVTAAGFVVAGTAMSEVLTGASRAAGGAAAGGRGDGPPPGGGAGPRRAGSKVRAGRRRRGAAAATAAGAAVIALIANSVAAGTVPAGNLVLRGTRPSAALAGSGQSVASVAFSPDGKILAAGDEGGGIRLWNTAARVPVAALADPSSSGVASVALSPDGKTLAAGDGDGSTYLWDTATGQLITAFTAPQMGSGCCGIGPVAFSPGGKILAGALNGAYDGGVRLWNTVTGEPVLTLADPSGYQICPVTFSPDGKTLAAGDNFDMDQPATTPASTYLWDLSKPRRAAVTALRSAKARSR